MAAYEYTMLQESTEPPLNEFAILGEVSCGKSKGGNNNRLLLRAETAIRAFLSQCKKTGDLA